LNSATLSAHAATIVQHVCEAEKELRAAALEVVGGVEPAALARHWHRQNLEGNQLLHIAAEDGHLEACRNLVQAGALIKAKNQLGETPAELARAQGHEGVCELLDGTQNITTVRGGTGDALEEALADDRPVVQVDWYSIALPGIAGTAGAFHSLLAITVALEHGDESWDGPSCRWPPHTYVIEKAALVRGIDNGVKDQFKNGVHVSHWVDVAPNVERDALYSLRGDAVRESVGDCRLTMSLLRDVAVHLGPYDVAMCNCHHAALAVYNTCAEAAHQVECIPNQLLTWGALMLRTVGFDVANSESGASRLREVVEQHVRQRERERESMQSLQPVAPVFHMADFTDCMVPRASKQFRQSPRASRFRRPQLQDSKR